ncbi:UDP-N-acetylglucosamine diphosphorylase [Candidatus Bipolaricaulota bacterium]|nr:UDP-N-acetylglucosamine diphosphorylase [Candidatus Bipolaricaulota bacterium]
MVRDCPDISAFFDLTKTDYSRYYRELEYPWEIVKRISNIIEDNLESERRGSISQNSTLGEEVEIGEGTVVEAGTMIKGPAIIGKNCEIRSGAYVRSNVVVGDGVTIGHSSEIKESLVHDEAEIPHFSYVGDSVIGWKGHLGAGVKISNLKVNREPIVVHLDERDVQTGLRKFGCLLGDEVEIGCNSVLNPGTLVGKKTLSMANVSLAGYYPPGSFVKLSQSIELTERKDKERGG